MPLALPLSRLVGDRRRSVAVTVALMGLGGCGGQMAAGPAPGSYVAPAVHGSAASEPRAAPARPARQPGVPIDPVLAPGVSLSGADQPAVAPGQVTRGPRDRPRVALTFDADMTEGMLASLHAGRVPGGWYDRALFAELAATHTPATIFLTGLWTSQYPQIVRRLAADPLFELENHTIDHAAFATPCFGLPAVATDALRRHEITGAAAVIERATGRAPTFFRFPGGCARPHDVTLVRAAGEIPVLWDVVSGDAFQRDPQVIVRAVLSGVRPGSIVVAHCIGAPNTPATAAAMRVIIPALRARGFDLVTLRDLLQTPVQR